MAGIKIVDLPPLGRDLLSTDLLELSIGGTASRKITGQEIMNASKLSVGSTPIISGTVGRLLFQGTGDVLQQSSGLFYDPATVRFGLNTSTPAYTLDVNGTTRFQYDILANSRMDMYGTIYMYNNITSLSGNIWLSNGYAIGDYATGNNRIEFYTTRLSFIGNGNEALRIVGSTGNLLVNTTTDAGFKLDVNGTARVQNTTTITKGGANYITLEASANTVAPYIQLFYQGVRDVRISAASNGFNFTEAGFVNPTQINAGNINANGGFTSAPSTGQSFVSLNGANGSTSAIYFREAGVAFRGALGFAGGSSDFTILQNLTGQTNFAGNERLRIFGATGNVAINTTTDAGFRLDVNGTARVSGAITCGEVNLSGSQLFTNKTTAPNSYLYSASSITILNGTSIRLAGGPVSINSANSGASADSSSILDVQSTTKGFLPPRMTNAQRAAIASPAVGLIVYCTDATEGLYVYKSTGWTFMV